MNFFQCSICKTKNAFTLQNVLLNALSDDPAQVKTNLENFKDNVYKIGTKNESELPEEDFLTNNEIEAIREIENLLETVKEIIFT